MFRPQILIAAAFALGAAGVAGAATNTTTTNTTTTAKTTATTAAPARPHAKVAVKSHHVRKVTRTTTHKPG